MAERTAAVMQMRQEIKSRIIVRKYKAGYTIYEEEIEFPGEKPFKHKVAYANNGAYIGNPQWAYRLFITKGIKGEAIPGEHGQVCSIGFCEREQKWYGWSHRAMFGFGIGSEVKRGDCAFYPSNEQEFYESICDWYSDKMYKKLHIIKDVDGVSISYEIHRRDNPKDAITRNVFEAYPEKWGRGSWVAKNLDDAKQMAIDFSRSVS